ncbi:DNA glycosylase AlkZ-like family protein [Microbispora sp. H11081]|uniref:winged helix-turn-helix domain-containing protein n=1 Tax=Microbispora sp. H11081 TaxID=2729107 RepID=UPI00289A3CF3|nr:crosslink repair DNA glycosylase YcaQ family protein [Microbispora sp. H11081]
MTDLTADPTADTAADLTADEARRIILRAQGFLGAAPRGGGVSGMLRRVGAVQLDTISVLARSHELVAYARLGAVGRAAVERAYWDDPARAFEYWCHAACVLPIEQWPLYAFRRRAYRERRFRWHEVPPVVDKVLEQVRMDGPLTSADIGGSKNGGPWWDWSDTKIAIEWLLDIGEVVCTRRVGWRRVYELAERAVPADLLAQDLSDAECVARLTGIAGRALGVATRADLADFIRVRAGHGAMLDEALLSGAAGLVPVRVAGWPARRGADAGGPNAWADPAALESEPRGRHRTTLLSPFDSLVWERARAERVFGLNHRLEAYVPKAKRVHGYFAMPVLAGGRIIGRVDPAREGATLVARQVGVEPGAGRTRAVEGISDALWEAASWVGCTDVRVERVTAPDLEATLRAALARGPRRPIK